MNEIAAAPPELEPGWHEVPMADYLAWPRVSSSALRIIQERPPAYLRWKLDGGEADDNSESLALSLGTLTHTAVLEPDLLDSEYVVEPEPDPERFTTANGKPASNVRATAAWKEMIAELESDGRKVVSAAAMNAAKEMRDAVHRHKRARQLIEAEGLVEVSGVVDDPETGVPLKIRPDKLIPQIGANLNVKTTKNAHPAAFGRDIYSFCYDRGAGFYKIALDALGFDHRRPLLLAIETDGPKLVAVREIDEGTLYAGEEQARALLQKIARCFERDEWPGYSDDIEPQSLPHWAWAKRDQQLQEIEYGY